MPIRVLRFIEYIYQDVETALADQERWTASYTTGNGKMKYRSATLPFELVEWDEGMPSFSGPYMKKKV